VITTAPGALSPTVGDEVEGTLERAAPVPAQPAPTIAESNPTTHTPRRLARFRRESPRHALRLTEERATSPQTFCEAKTFRTLAAGRLQRGNVPETRQLGNDPTAMLLTKMWAS
jgi:hypothetical protein